MSGEDLSGIAVRALVTSVLGRPPSLGAGRLVCVDGPAGSGKTTLAAELVQAFRDTPGPAPTAPRVLTLHMDDLYDGWDGLGSAMATVAASVVQPLRAGRPGRYLRYDWHRGAFAEERVVPPCDVLVVEGVGAAGPLHDGYADAITCLVWVDTPSDVRLARWAARDGLEMAEHASAWRAQEDAVLARERTRERADVVVAGAR